MRLDSVAEPKSTYSSIAGAVVFGSIPVANYRYQSTISNVHAILHTISKHAISDEG
jgi:hypothetical protein